MPNFVKFKASFIDKDIYINPDNVFCVTPDNENRNITNISGCGNDDNFAEVAESCESVVSRLASNNIYGYENKIHLCDSCEKCYPECDAKSENIIFGNGIGEDNICACSKYTPLMARINVLPYDEYNKRMEEAKKHIKGG